MLYTTLKLLRAQSACSSGLSTLTASLDAKHSEDEQISLSHIFKSNGLEHALWALRATTVDARKIAAHMSIDFAFEVIGNFEKQFPEDKRPRTALENARLFLDGKITLKEMESAARSAESAAESARSARAAWSAAESARSARSAARSAWSAAESAAESARSARSAWSAAESARSARSAWSAAESAAWSAAESAARSAWSAAESAAWSAAESAAWSAAESKNSEIFLKWISQE